MNIDITNIRGSLSKMGANTEVKKGYGPDDLNEFKIVKEILERFGIDTTYFLNNLSTLVIKKETAVDDSSIIVSSYNPIRNEIVYVRDEDLIHELFHMASNKMDFTSNLGDQFEKNGKTICKSLNEGITDLFTSIAVKNYELRYPLEALFASFLSEIYGSEIFKEHFKQHPLSVYRLFNEDMNDLSNIIVKLDEYTECFDSNIGLIPQKLYEFCTLYLNFIYKKDEALANIQFERIMNTFINATGNSKRIKDLIDMKIDIQELFKNIKESVFGGPGRS